MSRTATPSPETRRTAALDVERLRQDFPVLAERVNGRPLVYLDNAATTQKPRRVLDAISHYYHHDNANIHRGVHELSVRATDAYEAARGKLQRFIGASRPEEIIFTRGTTEAINLVASTYGRRHVTEGDEVLITAMEHHSNIVPWQLLCEQAGAQVRAAPINDRGEVELEAFEKLLSDKTKLVAIAHVSNALGTINPVAEMIRMAHAHGIPVLVDGAQAAAHLQIDVQALDVDFYCLSGHKLFGPTGVGVLYGKYALLAGMPPYQGGGDMIMSVTLEGSTYKDPPYRFEAGTPHIAGGIALGAAVDYVEEIGLERIAAYEHDLLGYATAALQAMPEVRLIGTAVQKASVLSFELYRGRRHVADELIHPHDIGTILNNLGIAIRTGHHCAQPVMDRFGVPATARASLALYNTRSEVDALVAGLRKVIEMFA
jgi:cysteine desulfurase/selenocysteine lyase